MRLLIRVVACGGCSVLDPRRRGVPTVRFLRHPGIYRSDVGGGLRPGSPLRGSTWSSLSASALERFPHIDESSRARFRARSRSSSAMSSDRLFLDRVPRQQSPSPLHRHPQNITQSPSLEAKEDISTLPGRGHFYFALTVARPACGSKVVMSSLGKVEMSS
jgi:hypothetical protein